MKRMLRNALVAAATAVVIGTTLARLGAAVSAPGLEDAGWVLACSIGILIYFILSTLGGNRQATRADAATRERALTFVCPPDQALVYFVRTGFVGAAMGVDICIDGRSVAQLKSPRFACVTLTPGPHALEARVGDGSSALVPASAAMSKAIAAGSVTLLHIGLRRNALKTSLVFEPWALETAKERLTKIGMVLATSTEASPQ